MLDLQQGSNGSLGVRASYEMLGRMELPADASASVMLLRGSSTTLRSITSQTQSAQQTVGRGGGGGRGTQQVFILASADTVEEALKLSQVWLRPCCHQ